MDPVEYIWVDIPLKRIDKAVGIFETRPWTILNYFAAFQSKRPTFRDCPGRADYRHTEKSSFLSASSRLAVRRTNQYERGPGRLFSIVPDPSVLEGCFIPQSNSGLMHSKVTHSTIEFRSAEGQNELTASDSVPTSASLPWSRFFDEAIRSQLSEVLFHLIWRSQGLSGTVVTLYRIQAYNIFAEWRHVEYNHTRTSSLFPPTRKHLTSPSRRDS